MVDTELVESEIQEGLEFVKQLDANGFEVLAAYWFYYSDSQRWRLTIVTPKADKGSRDLYLKAADIKSGIDLAAVEFVPPTNAVYKAIVGGRIIHMPNLGITRFSRSTFNGVFVEDAVFYRLRPQAA